MMERRLSRTGETTPEIIGSEEVVRAPKKSTASLLKKWFDNQ